MPTAEVAASSGTSVLCIRSHESAGRVVLCVVTGQMVGDRWWAGETIYLLRQPSFLVPPTGREHLDGSWTVYEMAFSVLPDGFLFSGLFWDFGSLYQRRCGHLLRQRHHTMTFRRP